MTEKIVSEQSASPPLINSRIPGFYKLKMPERVETLTDLFGLTSAEADVLRSEGALSHDVANSMIENVVGQFNLPLGLGLNFLINGKDYVIPMVVEEPSIVAAVSFAAKLARQAGGFTASADPGIMIGQIQIANYPDLAKAREALLLATEEIVVRANEMHPALEERGGGAKGVELRVLADPDGGEPILVLHLLIDTRDAMGANVVNTMAEGVAPLVEYLTGGKVYLRILSNLADRRLARAECRIAAPLLADFGLCGEEVCQGIVQASRFAEVDPYRAATHNKGIMNGIDAIAIATGNDWRAIESGAHAFAARDGRYRPLSTWRLNDGFLVGKIELPLAVGTVGGPIRVHPTVKLMLKILGISNARELAGVMATVGLAQNLAAIRALGSVGIQRGHMAMHARTVAATAGARGEAVERIALLMKENGKINLSQATELLARENPETTVTNAAALTHAAAPESAPMKILSAQDAEKLERYPAERFQFNVPLRWKSLVPKNPYAAEAQRQVLDWFAALGCTPAERARAAKFDAAGYVGIPMPNLSPALTVRIGKYLSMWLLWDDVQVECLENRWRLTADAVLQNHKPEGMTRFDEGWWQLFQEFAARRSRRWIQDLCDAMVTWNDAAVHEALVMEQQRKTGALPDFAVQLEMRTATIGMYATVYLLEDDYDFELPREFHAHRNVRRLTKLANRIVGLGNDILSFGKDFCEGQINLVSTLMSEKQAGADSAMEQLLRMHDAALVDYDRLAGSLGDWGDADPFIQRWVQDVRYAALGFSLWESQAPRYTAHKLVVGQRVVEPTFTFLPN